MSEPPRSGPLAEIRRVLAGQARMFAIKRYRESTGAGWADSADAIERMRGGAAAAAGNAAAAPPVSAEARAIGDALAAGKTVEAIKLYRAATGVGLKEAKDAIDAIKREKSDGLRLRRRAGASPVVVERRRISPAVLLLSLAAIFGTVFGLVMLLAGGR
jgi:ribosomal protein L7/L12